MGRDGQNFINRCTKPDRAEFLKISQAIGIGFVIMGTIGFIVKLGTFRAEDTTISPAPWWACVVWPC